MKYYLLLVSVIFLFSNSLSAKIYHSFADVAEKAIPGVVNIRTTNYSTTKGSHLSPYDFFLKGRQPPSSENHSLGSGVILDNQGYIITNYHVIKGASSIDVIFAASKQRTRAEIVGSDQKTDLALLKIKPRNGMVALDLGDSDKLRVGDIVLAIGNPFGFAHTITSGIISAKGRVIGTGPFDSFLQTDAPIHPGNSGGPLLDIRGRVIGINTAVSSEAYGIGFAIPVNLVRSIVKDLKQHGKVIRPWVGIIGKNVLSVDELGDNYDPIGVYGVIVENIIIDSPAFIAGIQIGDSIMAIDGAKIYDLNELHKQLSLKSPNDRVKFKIYRRSRGFIYLNVAVSVVPNAQDLPTEKDLL